jgi:glycosyltransferase involved in cell wall biosynthesis
MRICFVCSEYPPSPHGGIGTFTQITARALVCAGHEVRVVGIYSDSKEQPAGSQDQGVAITRIMEPLHRMGWLHGRYRLYQTLMQWARGREIDLIEVPDWQGLAARWGALPVPVVTRANGSATYFALEMGRVPKRLSAWLERQSVRRSDFWTAVSRHTAARTQSIFGLQPADAIPYNPVELPAVRPKPIPRTGVVFSGTLTEKKGIVSLIRAWSAVQRHCPGANLNIFGKDGTAPAGGSMKAFLQSIMDLETARTVTFHGHVSREAVLKALHGARVAVFPSYAEAFAIAPLEAMACRCPTIYSTRGSGPELIPDERCGFLVDPDRPEQITSAITRLLRDDELAKSIGRAGYTWVSENFTINRLLPRNESFFRECIDRFAIRLAAA